MTRMAVAVASITFLSCAPAMANPVSQDPAQMPPGRYVLDERHASLTMKISHMGGFSRLTMRFDRLSGDFAYDPAGLAHTVAKVSIDPKSIHSGVPGFDHELAGPRYLNAEKYPAIVFTSTEVEPGPDGKGKIVGDLTFLGVTKPVTLDVVFNGYGPGLLGQGVRLGFSGTGQIKRSDFGLTTARAFAGDTVLLDLEVEFVKQ